MSPFGRNARLQGCQRPLTMVTVRTLVGAAFFLPCGWPFTEAGSTAIAAIIPSKMANGNKRFMDESPGEEGITNGDSRNFARKMRLFYVIPFLSAART